MPRIEHFKRWDRLDEADDPAVVIFFAPPGVLSGLFTLANFDEVDPQAVIAPFGSGCSSIVYHPYRELDSDRPRAVLGMFDVSARPCVLEDVRRREPGSQESIGSDDFEEQGLAQAAPLTSTRSFLPLPRGHQRVPICGAS